MRAITFRNLAPGHWVNTETGVELARGKTPGHDGKLRWYVTRPTQGPKGRWALTTVASLAAARRYATEQAVPAMRASIAEAYTPNSARAEATQPSVKLPAPPPGRAAARLTFTAAVSAQPGATRYVSADGRYTIIGRPVAGTLGSDKNPDRAFTAYRSGTPVSSAHRRLTDAKVAAQADVEAIERAHNSARYDEAARVAGEPDWRGASSGLLMLAWAEDARRTGEARRGAGTGPRRVSGWGRLAEAHRSALV